MWTEVILALLVIIFIYIVSKVLYRPCNSASSSNWAKQILAKHSSVMTHGNSAKTRILIISTHPHNDNKHLNELLKTDSRTNKVTYHILPESETNISGFKNFFNPTIKPDFIDRVKNFFKPTIILMSPQNVTVYKALLQEVLILNQKKHKFGIYDLYETVNIPIVEPVILTFSVEATTNKVGPILKTMLKENKIPNDPSTRLLWIDGSHGDRRTKENKQNNSEEEYDSVGGESGLTNEYCLNSIFYEMACRDVGIQPNPPHFDSEPKSVPNVCTKGDFIRWKASASGGFCRPDISVDAVVLNPLPANSLLSDNDVKDMTINVCNIQDYHNHPDLRGDKPDALKKRREEFLRDIEDFSPTVVLIGWCYSANGDVALALRSSKIFPVMLFEHDLREMSGNKDARLDQQQKEVVEKMTCDAIRHCVFTGSSGSAKSLFAVEFTKKSAAMIVREDPSVNLEIIVCCLWIGRIEVAQMYQVWRKHFQAHHGFQITYMDKFDLCKRFGVDWDKYIDYGNTKCDFAGLINAVCSECESVNNTKQNNNQTIFLFDEAAACPTDGVSDFTKLSKLSELSSVSSAMCVNPFNFTTVEDFTVALPESCSVPCNKGHVQQCMYTTKLNTVYRNTQLMRKFLQFRQDHHGSALLSRTDDVLGANLPPGLPGDRFPVTWVQCATKEAMENAAEKVIDKVEKADKEAQIVMLYDKRDELCTEVVSKFKGRYKVFHFTNFLGCESDTILYFTNNLLDHEAVSRGRKKLITISGPDFHTDDERLLKVCAASQHSHRSVGGVKCRDKPCGWSEGWRPLVEHLVICGHCGEMVERSDDKCSHCGGVYEEPSGLVRTKVEDLLPGEKTSVSKEELEALGDKEEIVTLTKQIDEAWENDDKVQWKTLTQQLGELIPSISPSVHRAMSRERLRRHFEIPVTDEILEALCDNDEVNTLTKQMYEALDDDGNDDDSEDDKLITLIKQLYELIPSITPSVDDRKRLQRHFELMETSVSDEIFEALCDNNEVNALTKQMDEALDEDDSDDDDEDNKLITLRNQLDALISSITPT